LRAALAPSGESPTGRDEAISLSFAPSRLGGIKKYFLYDYILTFNCNFYLYFLNFQLFIECHCDFGELCRAEEQSDEAISIVRQLCRNLAPFLEYQSWLFHWLL